MAREPPPPPWPPTHLYCCSGQELAAPPARDFRTHPYLPARCRYSASPRANNNILLYSSSSGPLRMRFLHSLLLLYLAHRGQYGKKMRTKKTHSRYRKDFFRSLSIEERRRRYRKIPRCALIPMKLSPWQKLRASQNDQAYITMTGFDFESFEKILERFAPMFSGHTPFNSSGMIDEFEYTTGQKREVKPADCLGLVLVWTRTQGSFNVCNLFLDSPIPTSLFI